MEDEAKIAALKARGIWDSLEEYLAPAHSAYSTSFRMWSDTGQMVCKLYIDFQPPSVLATEESWENFVGAVFEMLYEIRDQHEPDISGLLPFKEPDTLC
jgi:hypothetical protein